MVKRIFKNKNNRIQGGKTNVKLWKHHRYLHTICILLKIAYKRCKNVYYFNAIFKSQRQCIDVAYHLPVNLVEIALGKSFSVISVLDWRCLWPRVMFTSVWATIKILITNNGINLHKLNQKINLIKNIYLTLFSKYYEIFV